MIANSDIVVLRQRLRVAGFAPLPCVGKHPIPKAWQFKTETNDAEIELWGKAYPNASNTGVLCRTVPTLDIDILDPEAADAVEELVHERFEDRGALLIRIGKAPKRAILFRCETPFKKRAIKLIAPNGSEQKLEFLGDGQQVIVAGIHPDTEQPYRWHGGDPGTMTREALPEIDAAEAQELIEAAADLLCNEFGYTRVAVHPRSNGHGDGEQRQYAGAPASVRELAYGEAALEGCAAELANKTAPGRNDLANALAYRLGRMVARGWVSREDAEAALMEALTANGYIKEHGAKSAEVTLKSGLDSGERIPCPDLPDDQGTSNGGDAGGGGGDDGGDAGDDADGETPDTETAPCFSEEALALDFATRHAGDLRHVAMWGKWLCWDGRQWTFDETHRAFDMARRICRDAASHINKPGAARAIASAKTRAAVLSLATDDRRLAAYHEQWDLDPMLLNTPGGIVDLRTGALRRATPADYVTKMTAVAPGGACPQWRRFLETVTGDNPGLENYLQVACGYSLTGLTTEEVLLFLHGQGQNGKSVFIRTIAGVLGSYHTTAPVETFLDTKQDRHPTEIAGLRGARMVSAAETEQGRRWSETKIKTLTGGDKISARLMRQDFFEFRPQFTLWIHGNHKPGLRAVDKAITRRLRLLPFTTTIEDDARDNELSAKLQQEWPGILAWMIQGCLIWQREGLVAPQVVSAATDEYLASEDVVERFVEERCVKDPQAWTGTTDLYNAWKSWAEDNGEFTGSMKRFARMLEGKGYRQMRRSYGRGFVGLKRA
jgi:putative DNA primase/helicase